MTHPSIKKKRNPRNAPKKRGPNPPKSPSIGSLSHSLTRGGREGRAERVCVVASGALPVVVGGAGDGDEVAVGVEGEVGDEAGDAEGEAASGGGADGEAGGAGAGAGVVEGVEVGMESAGVAEGVDGASGRCGLCGDGDGGGGGDGWWWWWSL